MSYSPLLRTCLSTLLIALATSFTSIHASIVDSGTFSNTQASGNNIVVATSQFSLASGDIPNVTFDANFNLIDAGIEIRVNGTSFFNTGDDVSNFGPQVFQPTAVQPDNIDFSFDPNNNNLPRLTVDSDATGTAFTGTSFVNSSSTVNFIPLFNVANFNSLLQPGLNTIEIVNLNNFQGASLSGDYSVELPVAAVASIPEPSAFALCLAGGLFFLARRRR